VGAHQYGAAAVHEGPEQLLEEARALGVQAHHRLVHHDVLGPVNDRARDDQLLPHPVAVRLDQLVLPVGQLEEIEQLVHPLLDGLPLLPVERGHEPQELRARQLVVHVGPVRDEPQPRLGRHRGAGDVVAADRDGSRGRLQDAGDHAHRGRLAGAVGPEEAIDHPRRNVERDPVHRGERAVALGQSSHPDHRASAG
jgi:hypothetical protein